MVFFRFEKYKLELSLDNILDDENIKLYKSNQIIKKYVKIFHLIKIILLN